MLRVLHFSDVHLGCSLRSMTLRDWLGKRAIGAANLVLRRRGRRFAGARDKLAALVAFERRRPVDLVVFTGDYTALGLEAEYAAARRAVEPLMQAPLGYVNVPGNHDLYVAEAVRARRFARHFDDTLATDLPEYRRDGPWPVARLVGEDCAVICVDSARPNPVWLSSGCVPPGQLEALERMLSDERLSRRFVFVVTHYPPRLADGGPDSRLHGLDNADAFLRACGRLDRGAILCGHTHHRFHVRVPETRAPIFCAGSATLDGREGFWLFEIAPASSRALPGRLDGGGYVVEESAAVDLATRPFDSRESLQQA